ncbi:MAG: serine hydrolase [Clostridiales bacterium]|nr:serine hydrolase [Clostridiales bacterium]
MKYLDQAFDSYEKKIKSDGMAFCIESGDGSYHWKRESGKMVNDRCYGIASVTKMYTASIILKLIDEGMLAMTDKIEKHLSSEIMERLPNYKGISASREITIHNLLAQTSGIPDYFTEALKGDLKKADQIPGQPDIMREEMLNWLVHQKLKFNPVKESRAHYSDMNYDLLGVIIENITKKSFEYNVEKYIIEPLQLHNTRVFFNDSKVDFPGVWSKGEILCPKNVLSSGPASGGIISTVQENIKFLKAFWNAQLFEANHLEHLKIYHHIQFIPLQYGVGHMRFKQIGIPEFIGHSGSSGTVCYYMPKEDLYITGTINECNEAKAIRMMFNLMNCCIRQRRKK